MSLLIGILIYVPSQGVLVSGNGGGMSLAVMSVARAVKAAGSIDTYH